MMFDYLIVGQGLAGSMMATNLLRIGKQIAVVDRHHFPTASSVAAGLINPFTGPKMVKSWKFDDLITFAINYYRDAESVFEKSFFEERILFRPFYSVGEQNDWHGKSTLEGYREYIHKICDSTDHAPYVHNPFGGLETRSWLLNVPAFLKANYYYLKKHCLYQEEQFNEDILEIIDQNTLRYRDIVAQRILFCTGYESINSTYFGWLPLVPVKGELLDIKMEVDFETIYNRNCFIIPQGGGLFRAGSTYDRTDISMEPTTEAKSQILTNISQMTSHKFEVISQKAGIRPGTLTRRPLIGQHPEIKTLFIFNGLGTKGVSLAPYFSQQFVDTLERGNYLHDEVDIKKYYSLYFNSHFAKRNNT